MLFFRFFCVIISSAHLFAAGGPPMMSDGTGTPGNGNWEINIAYKGDFHSKTTEFPTLDINYGWSENIQLKAESSYVSLSEEDNHNRGIGNAKIGLKWRFYDNSSDALSISTYPQYSFAPNKNNASRGLADKDTTFFLPLELTQEFDKISVSIEIGCLMVERDDDYLKSGVVLGYRPFSGMEFLVEIYRSALNNGDDETVNLNTGMTYAFSPNIGLLLSIGREIIRDDEPQSTAFFTGLQLLF